MEDTGKIKFRMGNEMMFSRHVSLQLLRQDAVVVAGRKRAGQKRTDTILGIAIKITITIRPCLDVVFNLMTRQLPRDHLCTDLATL